MVLSMVRPWKHPKTGIYWFRKRVPDRLRLLVGKREEKFSLGTTDPVEAKRRHAEALAQVDLRWANLLRADATLSAEEADRLAEPIYRNIMASYTADPLQPRDWSLAIGDAMLQAQFVPEGTTLGRMITDGWHTQERMERRCQSIADELLAKNGLRVDLAGRCMLNRAVLKATQAAFGEVRDRDRYPYSSNRQLLKPREVERHAGPVPFRELLEGWEKEKQPAQKTIYTWRRIVDAFTAHLGHKNAAAVTADDIVAWKNAMIKAGLAAKTIQFGKIAAIRALLQWGVDNRRLPANVVLGIKIGNAPKVGKTKRSFTEDEARTILSAARREKTPHLRWAPWVCAFTGARISEVCQLRKQDVEQHEGVWVFKIAAEAGSVKNANSERAVPLHSALVAEGFLQFVESAKPGPLFPELAPDRFGSRGGNGTKLIGRWVRKLGIEDERISPSHSWRHRFKTLARRHGLALDLVNAITGHGRKDVADTYGEYPLDALSRELEKIPRTVT